MEHTSSIFVDVVMLLGGGILAGTLFKRIGLGTVLGYLAAGIVMGPLLRLFDERSGEILHIGELGVVFLLFIIGLELKLSRLWALRRRIFGLGLAQVLTTGLLLHAAAVLFGAHWQASLIVSFGLALSSTAFALQFLEESGEINTRHGQAAFSVLLFQDLAIVPLLALVPALARSPGEAAAIDPQHIVAAVSALALLVLAGRYLLNPLFRVLADSGAREVMIGAALFVVLASATLMAWAGFSMAMGAFIAGVLLAESSYRHELEANIDPFRGLLLGLFFIAVGLSLDLPVIARQWLAILLLTPALMATKAIVVFALCRLFGESRDTAIRVAAVLPQGGEFAFVLFSAASAARLFDGATASLLVAVVTLSMALTPVSAWLGGRLIGTHDKGGNEIDEDFEGAGSEVLMIGFSRFGQMVAQVLLSSGVGMTIIDSSAERIATAARFGFRIYFGSGLRRDVLEAAGIRKSRLVAVCTNGQENTDRIVDLIRSEFPNVPLFVRSYDRNHSLSLRARGIAYELRETLESALTFGGETLERLGVDQTTAVSIVDDVRRRDAERLILQETQGVHAGIDHLVTTRVTPEPLVRPRTGPGERSREGEVRRRVSEHAAE